MILLDTNVVSEAMTREPHPRVRAWLDAQAAETVFLSSITVAELLFGIGVLPAGRRRDTLAAALEDVLDLFAARILPFDTPAARRHADLAVTARAAGKGFPTPGWLHRRDRRRARVRRGIARHECVRCRRSDGDRSLEPARRARLKRSVTRRMRRCGPPRCRSNRAGRIALRFGRAAGRGRGYAGCTSNAGAAGPTAPRRVE